MFFCLISVDMWYIIINCYNNVIYLLFLEGLVMCLWFLVWDFVVFVEFDDVNLFIKILLI